MLVIFTKPPQPFANCEKLTASSMQVIPDNYQEARIKGSQPKLTQLLMVYFFQFKRLWKPIREFLIAQRQKCNFQTIVCAQILATKVKGHPVLLKKRGRTCHLFILTSRLVGLVDMMAFWVCKGAVHTHAQLLSMSRLCQICSYEKTTGVQIVPTE